MAYDFYLGKILLPVTPSKLSMKIGGQNKTYNMIDDGEINVLKSPKLTDIEFDFLLPNQKYSFAKYKSGFKSADYFLSALEDLKYTPFQFIVSRSLPNGKKIYGTNIKVSLENYNSTEDSKNGFDVTVSVKLKQYVDYGTKVAVLTVINDEATATTSQVRNTDTAPSNDLPKPYQIQRGDCLSNLAKRFYDNGSKSYYMKIANANGISNPNKIYAGKTITIPAL